MWVFIVVLIGAFCATSLNNVFVYALTTECSVSEFDCGHGLCINSNAECDGINDCGDWSDETNCTLEKDRTFSFSTLCRRNPGRRVHVELGPTTKSLASTAVIMESYFYFSSTNRECELEIRAPPEHHIVASLRKINLGKDCNATLKIREHNMTHMYCEEEYDQYENRTITTQGHLVITVTGADIEKTFPQSTGFQLTVTAYRNKPCNSTTEFSCANGRCIAKELKCSEYNHCGDNSHLCDPQTIPIFYFSDICPISPPGRAHLYLGAVTESLKSTALIKMAPHDAKEGYNCEVEIIPPSGHSVLVSIRRIQFRGNCVDNMTVYTQDTQKTYCGLGYDEYENNTIQSDGHMIVQMMTVDKSPRFRGLKITGFELTVTAYADRHCDNEREFSCENGRCIAKELNCSEHNHCGDNSNRQCGTSTNPPKKCPSSKFRCANGRCIFPVMLCNGENDCGDLSDEMSCKFTCPSSYFPCKNGMCIWKFYVCDKQDDCGDGSDEEDCKYTCSYFDFTCNNGLCIPDYKVCNGIDDCGDRSDEQRCSSRKPSTAATSTTTTGPSISTDYEFFPPFVVFAILASGLVCGILIIIILILRMRRNIQRFENRTTGGPPPQTIGDRLRQFTKATG